MAVETILDRIVATTRQRLESRPEAPGLEQAARRATEERRRRGLRSLRSALVGKVEAVIAECKHASPSAGILRADFDPVSLARSYQAAGAAAISVVTEPDYFGGDPKWVAAVRAAVELPVLRKDFVVTPRQLMETAVAGADAVLLIARVLDQESLAELMEVAASLELEVLLEIFTDEDPAMAIASGAELLGVNARDLGTFELDVEGVAAMADNLPSDRIRVAESGINCRRDLLFLGKAGYGAFLIGSHLVKADNPGAALEGLLGPGE